VNTKFSEKPYLRGETLSEETAYIRAFLEIKRERKKRVRFSSDYLRKSISSKIRKIIPVKKYNYLCTSRELAW